MNQGKKGLTIQDVARHARVSAATVSRAISSPERVSETTRMRVQAAIHATGYTMNQAARSLRMRAARTLLVALPDIGNPFYSRILGAVVEEASSSGYGILVGTHVGIPKLLIDSYFSSGRVDGLLLFDGGIDTNAFSKLAPVNGRLPMVSSFDEAVRPGFNSVAVDNHGAIVRAVQYLVELGHRQIGHIYGINRTVDENVRLVGFRDGMRAAGLPVKPEWLAPGNFSMPGGARAMRAILAAGPPPTAIVAANDELAIGAMAVMREAGLSCPRDVSVTGFDDIGFATFTSPPLTTMRQPREEIGRRAARIVIDILEAKSTTDAPIIERLPCELVLRESTAPPRAAV